MSEFMFVLLRTHSRRNANRVMVVLHRQGRGIIVRLGQYNINMNQMELATSGDKIVESCTSSEELLRKHGAIEKCKGNSLRKDIPKT